MQKFVPRSRIENSKLVHPIHPIGPKTRVLMRVVVFGCILDCSLLHDAWCKTGWTGAINAELRAMKSHQNFFATNAPNPPHRTPNSCFGASRIVWVYLTIFRYYTKLGAKRVALLQLMHKFVPWNRIGIFRNEHTRSTPLNPKIMYWCVS